MAEVKNGDATDGSSKALKLKAVTLIFIEYPKANDAVLFYKAAFGAEEVNRVSYKDMISVEIEVGETPYIVTDISDEPSDSAPRVSGGGVFILETDDIEAGVEKALRAGAVETAAVEVPLWKRVMFGGVDEAEKNVKDPYGNLWLFCSPANKDAAAAAPTAEVRFRDWISGNRTALNNVLNSIRNDDTDIIAFRMLMYMYQARLQLDTRLQELLPPAAAPAPAPPAAADAKDDTPVYVAAPAPAPPAAADAEDVADAEDDTPDLAADTAPGIVESDIFRSDVGFRFGYAGDSADS